MRKGVSSVKGVSAIKGVSQIRARSGQDQVPAIFYSAQMNHSRLIKEKTVLVERLESINHQLKETEEIIMTCYETCVKSLPTRVGKQKKGEKGGSAKQNGGNPRLRATKISF